MIRIICFWSLAAVSLLSPAAASAQKFYTYVGDLGPHHVLLAWGTTGGVNTIGRSSPSHGPATIKLEDRTFHVTERNWVVLENLLPDTEYTYEVALAGRKIGEGSFRTWALKAERLCFFVIGDMGNGRPAQYRVAQAMTEEFERKRGSDCPIRFVLTVGDNVYGEYSLFGYARTGAADSDWGPKFFQPYETMLGQVPFYPTLGNHDGNETERTADLAVNLDNLFFPGNKPARYSAFSYGELADFFGLDTTHNTAKRGEPIVYARGGEQHKWLAAAIARSTAPWKIPFFHHPPFNAGPRHPPSLGPLEHFVDLFVKHGVKAAFTGHEHNLQISEQSERTRGIRFIVTGAGGELRPEDVRTYMDRRAIAGWAPQNHWTSVEIEGQQMKITPMSFEKLRVIDSRNREFPLPVEVNLP